MKHYTPPDPDVEKAWIAEAKRRHQELLDGRARSIPGEQVFANVRALLAERKPGFTERRK